VTVIAEDSIVYRLIGACGRTLFCTYEMFIRLASSNMTFYEAQQFPWSAELEANWRAIRAELEDVLRRADAIPEFKTLSKDQARITHGNAWRTFFFYAYGQRVDDNCMRCPETVRLVEKIPGMTTAMFSIFTPGTYLTAHRGPFKGVLRYHLGLRIPSDASACGIRVGEKTRSWHEGVSLIFDDTHEHEAWNRSQEDRVVLFVDFIRPLPFPLSVLNRGMIRLIASSPLIQNLMRRINALNRRVADVEFPPPSTNVN
jgi:aspartyl/asparaginyl beta-hydroxylase (cupin superfamily)